MGTPICYNFRIALQPVGWAGNTKHGRCLLWLLMSHILRFCLCSKAQQFRQGEKSKVEKPIAGLVRTSLPSTKIFAFLNSATQEKLKVSPAYEFLRERHL